MKTGEELVAEYRTGGSQRVWDKLPEEMKVPELRDYLIHCQGERFRVQALMYQWATEMQGEEVPLSELSCMVEDISFLSGLIETVGEMLDQAITIVNTDGCFLASVYETLSRLRDTLEVLERQKSYDDEEREMLRAEEMEVRELVNYWECVLADNGVTAEGYIK